MRLFLEKDSSPQWKGNFVGQMEIEYSPRPSVRLISVRFIFLK